MNKLADDQYENSQIQEPLNIIRNCSTRNIEYAIAELEAELKERDPNYVKEMKCPA